MTKHNPKVHQLALEISRIDALLDRGIPRARREAEHGRLDFGTVGREDCNTPGCLLKWALYEVPGCKQAYYRGDLPEFFGCTRACIHSSVWQDEWFSGGWAGAKSDSPIIELNRREASIRRVRDEKAAELEKLL